MILQERDKQLLKGLYNMRILSAAQIKRVFYGNSVYGYARVPMLEKHGYLGSQPYVEGRKKVTQYYYLTEKGIDALEVKNPRQATKNAITEKGMVERQLLVNEVPISIMQLEQQNGTDIWQWVEAREAKEQYQFNMGDLIAGVLENKKTGDKYGIYVPTKKSNIEGLIATIYSEIDRHAYIRDNIIICPPTDIFKEFRKNMKPIGRSLRILPSSYGIRFIYNILSDYAKTIEKLYYEMESPNHPLIRPSDEIYATHESRNCYFNEFLTNNITAMHDIEKYAQDPNNTIPIHILCWDAQEVHILDEFEVLKNNKKVELLKVKWKGNQFLRGIDEGMKLVDFGKKDKPKKVRMSFTFSTDIVTTLESIPEGKRSKFLENLIRSIPPKEGA